ncbi:hypothetical protein K469DRAFT_598434, partial [Zopfia rhizophila CBS 207.26]
QHLECRLHRVKLDEAPPYEALLYVWRDPNARVEIICDEIPFMVTLNFRDALVGLQLRSVIRTIWADAICVN